MMSNSLSYIELIRTTVRIIYNSGCNNWRMLRTYVSVLSIGKCMIFNKNMTRPFVSPLKLSIPIMYPSLTENRLNQNNY